MGRLIGACEEKAPIQVWNAADIGVQAYDVGLEGSLTHVIKTFAPKLKRQGEMLEGDAKTVVQTLVGKLREKRLLARGTEERGDGGTEGGDEEGGA